MLELGEWRDLAEKIKTDNSCTRTKYGGYCRGGAGGERDCHGG